MKFTVNALPETTEAGVVVSVVFSITAVLLSSVPVVASSNVTVILLATIENTFATIEFYTAAKG